MLSIAVQTLSRRQVKNPSTLWSIMLLEVRPNARTLNVADGLSHQAIAGPMVQFDIRDMYPKDIQLIGCTAGMNKSSQTWSATLSAMR